MHRTVHTLRGRLQKLHQLLPAVRIDGAEWHRPSCKDSYGLRIALTLECIQEATHFMIATSKGFQHF